MPFYKQPGTTRPTAHRFDCSGYPDIAKFPRMTLPICWPKRQPYRKKHTRFAFCYHAREHTLGKGFTPNRRKNGTSQALALICVRSTTNYQPSTRDGSTAPCLENERTYQHSCEPDTAVYQHTQRPADCETTISVSGAKGKAFTTCF
jgi:hypothetical protein